jgi:hypothetical protein
MPLFEPNTWYAMDALPENWKDNRIPVDLWIPDKVGIIAGYRVADCHWVCGFWMVQGALSFIADAPSHWMRVEGPPPPSPAWERTLSHLELKSIITAWQTSDVVSVEVSNQGTRIFWRGDGGDNITTVKAG